MEKTEIKTAQLERSKKQKAEELAAKIEFQQTQARERLIQTQL